MKGFFFTFVNVIITVYVYMRKSQKVCSRKPVSVSLKQMRAAFRQKSGIQSAPERILPSAIHKDNQAVKAVLKGAGRKRR